ncbi:MAG: hypothetical protein OXI60_09240 [Acidiferrobacterales bacterium]|nr:hypothetical protein [Acidiferrobacterales bacterium]
MTSVRYMKIGEIADGLKPVNSRFVNNYGLFLNQVQSPCAPTLRHTIGMLLDFAGEPVLPGQHFVDGFEH